MNSRTQLNFNSFLPSTIREWNNLPDHIKQKPSVNTFKHAIKSRGSSVRPPKHYYFGERREQILHVRLRTNCSSLNQHLFEKNIVESPLCQCGEIENAWHFFFACPLFNDLRVTLFDALSQFCIPTLDIILYGDLQLSLESNESIFLAVHQFISQTKRFLTGCGWVVFGFSCSNW